MVLHHHDPSTDFLCPIYADLPGTVLRRSVPAAEMTELIRTHQRIILLGHGHTGGLFFMLDGRHAASLASKADSLFIWCHASSFAHQHGLPGFATGMFISEVSEARYCGISESHCTTDAVNRSNNLFVRLVAENVEAPAEKLFQHVLAGYQDTDGCPIINYNRTRLRLLSQN